MNDYWANKAANLHAELAETRERLADANVHCLYLLALATAGWVGFVVALAVC